VNPQSEKVLAIGAHPDDVELCAGGRLRRLAAGGARISILVVTDGARGGDPKERENEARAVAARLQADLIWGGLPDTNIPRKEAIRLIEKAITLCEPTRVLTHDSVDTHGDHRLTTECVLVAARNVANVEFCEGPSTVNFVPVSFVEIDLEQKLDLVRVHRSQDRRSPIAAWACATALFRGFQMSRRMAFAEAFRPVREVIEFPQAVKSIEPYSLAHPLEHAPDLAHLHRVMLGLDGAAVSQPFAGGMD
jgi:LmbE family N-acetylglucosaminyl deacetylase